MIDRSTGALALLLACVPVAGAAAPAPSIAAAAANARNDFADRAFVEPLSSGLRAFYTRDFKKAQAAFERSLAVVPDNTLAISFLNAAAAQQPGALDVLTNVEEDAVSGAPKNYVDHVRLGFSYLFEAGTGRDRSQDARDELTAAANLQPESQAAHVGLGIMRFNERSTNRSKTEFLAALRVDGDNVLAREYLGELYQSDLRDPARGLAYVIDVPNLVPEYADITFHIGSLLNDLHESDAAVGYIQRGIALDPGHVGEAGQHGYTLLARIYIEQHKLAAATTVLSTAVASDVDSIYARTLLAKIKAGDYDARPTPGSSRAPESSGVPDASPTHSR